MKAILATFLCLSVNSFAAAESKVSETHEPSSWIQDAISMVAFIEENGLIMREDSYDKYEILIQNAPSQEKMDRLYQLLTDSAFVGTEDIWARFMPYYVAEIDASNSREHQDSLRVLKLTKAGLADLTYDETIAALEALCADPNVHPFAAIRALSVAGFLYGYSGEKEHIVNSITKMENLANGRDISPYIAKEINGLKGFSAHLINDPEEVVKLSVESLKLSHETEGIIYGATAANNFTHLVVSYGDAESIKEIDKINRRIAYMTGDDGAIFRAHVLCLESGVKWVQTDRAIACLKQAETYKVENSQGDVRLHLYGMIALARDGQISEAKRFLEELEAIPNIRSNVYYKQNIEWALSELHHADAKFENAYAGLRSHYNKNLLKQKLELGKVSRAIRQYSEEKSALMQDRADTLLQKEVLQKRVIDRQKLLIMMAGILVGFMMLFVYLQMKIGQKLKRAQREMIEVNKRISLEARTDQLTRIGNRRAFYEYCEELLEKKAFHNIALALLDLDGFKAINDTYGHEIGDRIIAATASRLDNALDSVGRVFRLGGDEMAILYLEEDDANLSAFKSCLSNGLSGPVKTEARDFDLIWSVGVTRCEDAKIAPMQYLKQADYALYQAKKISGQSFHIFSTADLKSMRHDYIMPDEITWCLNNEELLMFGQIIVDTRDSKYQPLGVEALLRAQTRRGDPIAPEIFIKHAVAMGHADRLTELTLSKSIDMYEAAGLDCALLFNLSPEQIRAPHFPKNILNILKNRGFLHQNLIIELSERTLNSDLKGAQRDLRALQAKGIRIALDDFGSANTGFSTLFDFGFDFIKTDRQLLSSAMQTPRSQMLLENLIKFGQKMNVPCIIEGTENSEEVSFVKNLGGEIMQGYLFGHPEESPKFRPYRVEGKNIHDLWQVEEKQSA